ncbi:MAG: methyltransferase domain-containing protein [Phycisphaerales bacterium]|nr:methyltransferase domain-containing protein [Phycisphaerales bacterium]
MDTTGGGFYDDPRIYDVLHAQGTADEVAGLQAICRRFLPRWRPGRGTWLEPACGTARYLRAAARRGIDCVGIDLHPASVAYARARLRALRSSARWRIELGDVTDLSGIVESNTIAFAFCLINTIRHLPDGRSMAAHLREIARVLRPDGVYAVGLSLTAYGREQATEDHWHGHRAGLDVRQVVQYLPPGDAANPEPRSELVVSHLTITRRGRVEHRDAAYRLRTYSLSQWLGVIARSPLRTLAVVDEQGDDVFAHEPGYAIFILGRR